MQLKRLKILKKTFSKEFYLNENKDSEFLGTKLNFSNLISFELKK